jgi:hypothetical protein
MNFGPPPPQTSTKTTVCLERVLSSKFFLVASNFYPNNCTITHGSKKNMNDLILKRINRFFVAVEAHITPLVL